MALGFFTPELPGTQPGGADAELSRPRQDHGALHHTWPPSIAPAGQDAAPSSQCPPTAQHQNK